MCNLHSITINQAAIIALLRVMNKYDWTTLTTDEDSHPKHE